MNKERKRRFSILESRYDALELSDENFIEKAKELQKDFERLMDEEQDVFDNMPENLQGSRRGEESEEYIDDMQDYIDEIDNCIEEVQKGK